ncbi:siderochrome-iron transporter [Aspergillus luchuensis]|uniref:Siderochrome-iron transporter n=1 Tax=Aspergillus kawachii TaxID=1069201 RepID=A0A146F8D1_ASPKA|nr:siderochrome-iron transporter [Aspergillus luchuensis]
MEPTTGIVYSTAGLGGTTRGGPSNGNHGINLAGRRQPWPAAATTAASTEFGSDKERSGLNARRTPDGRSLDKR